MAYAQLLLSELEISSVSPSGTTEFSGDLFVADNRPVTITTGVIISHRYSLGVPVKILL